ncbi:hypothetical protein JW921_07500, partial [Candidatus Fermentibacterales bacterium]|nr:hypothetical protein [Candidatus Fermentibacterales bacterium]
DPADRHALDESIASVRSALEKHDDAATANELEKLRQKWSEVAARFYQQQGQTAQPGEQASEGGSTPEGTVDADFEVVDE